MVRHTSIDAFPELRLEEQHATNSPTKRHSSFSKDTRQSMLTDSLRLKTSDTSMNRAAYAMIFAVLADAINVQCCAANYPLMVTPGAHADSFSNTEPFDIITAQYVIVCAVCIGLVISNFLFGWLAMKIGARKIALVLVVGSVVFTIVKYLVRGSYWGFVAMAFINSLFGSSVAVGSGYVYVIFRDDRAKADRFIGYLMATMVGGRTLGALFSVMFPRNLFFPLIPAAVISAASFLAVYKLLQPNLTDDDGNEKSGLGSPDKLDRGVFVNIISGALIDNIGSLGIVPRKLCSVPLHHYILPFSYLIRSAAGDFRSVAFSPCMYETFLLNPVMEGRTPIMSENEYRWLFSMIALAAVPAAL